MSKALSATCTAGVVKVGALPVPGATVLSEGVAASEGVLLIEEEVKTYIAKISPDLKTTLEKVISCLDEISSALTTISSSLTSIGAGMTGPTTAPPPTLATDVASITTDVASISTLKAQLETLKGALK